MSNPVEALVAKWRLFAADLRDTTGYNTNYLCQRQVACLHQCADELASALASLRSSPEVERNGIVSRIVRGCGLDPDAIPYDEGTDPVEHLIRLFQHHREQAEADGWQPVEQADV